MAEGNHAGASQRRDVDNRFRFETLNVGQDVAQHQAAFGVGVQHFHRLAGHGGQNVARTIGATARHVFTARQHADDVQRQLQLGNHPHHAVHRRGAAHVVLHLVHAFGRLDGDAARVEGQAFTDQHDRARVLRRVAFILDDRHQRLVLRAVADGEIGVHPQLAHLLFADHAGNDVLAVGIGQLTRLGSQIGGVTDVRRHVAKIFRRFDAGGDR